MLNIALTGGIGSGKSLIASIFKVLGVPVFHADTEAKKLYSLPEVIELVRLEFSSAITDENQINTKALAKIVFSDPDLLVKLNSIIHLRVLNAFEEWQKQSGNSPYIIMESAIVFEAGLTGRFDNIITVYAPQELCIGRIIKRDGITREEVLQRMHSQIDPEKKIKNSRFVIYNDEKQLVIPQVLSIHETLIESK